MSGAQAKKRRSITARELAERLGSSERTARRLVAEPRDEFLDRAEVRRRQASELRAQGLKYREIAETMEISIGTVGRLLHDARRIDEQREWATELLGRGLTHSAIAEQMKISTATLGWLLGTPVHDDDGGAADPAS